MLFKPRAAVFASQTKDVKATLGGNISVQAVRNQLHLARKTNNISNAPVNLTLNYFSLLLIKFVTELFKRTGITDALG